MNTETSIRHRPLTVGLSGPAGTGRTTLVTLLSEYFEQEGQRVSTVTGTPREVFRLYRITGMVTDLNSLLNDPGITLEYQRDVLEIQIRKEKQALSSGADLILCDWTVYDTWLDTLLYTTRHSNPDLYDRYCSLLFAHLSESPYDLIACLNPLPGKPADDFDQTWQYRLSSSMSDQILTTILSPLSSRLFKVTATDLHERFGYLVYILKEALEWKTGKNG